MRKSALPYDSYCPIILETELTKRVCCKCGIYHPSQAAVSRHRRGTGCVDEADPTEEAEINDNEGDVAEEAGENAAPMFNIL